MHFAGHGLAVCVNDADTVAAYFCEVALLKIDEALRNRQQRRHAAGDKVFTVAQTDDEWTRNPTYDNAVRVFRVHNEQRISTFKTFNRFANRRDKVHSLTQVIMNQMRGNLGVGLRIKPVPLFQHFILDRLKVLNDAVVNYRDATAG